MKKERIFVIIGIIIVVVAVVVVYQSTYAKYRKKVTDEVNMSIASWNIKINDESIAGQSTLTGNITPVFEENENVADGVIAPGATGYFDIDIDATDVDVSFSYNLTTVVANSDYSDIKAYAYSIDGGEQTDYDSDEGISGTIAHNTESTIIRIYVIWDDDEDNNMDNTEDTALAISNDEITMNATFLFTQINS